MAAPVVQVLESGDRNHVIHVVGEADSTGGTIVDVSTFPVNSQNEPVVSLRLDQIQYETSATVKIDDTSQTQFVAPPGQDTKNYQYAAGLRCADGDILIPAPAASADYTMTLWFRKKY